jgi:hypothetical protein
MFRTAVYDGATGAPPVVVGVGDLVDGSAGADFEPPPPPDVVEPDFANDALAGAGDIGASWLHAASNEAAIMAPANRRRRIMRNS